MKLTPEQFHAILQRPGMQKVNPLAGLPNPERQPDQRGQSQDHQLEKSPTGVGYCVTIISCRKKLVDAHDNLRTGAKPLVDAITASLGFASDDNERLQWDYQQFKSNETPCGTIVLIHRQFYPCASSRNSHTMPNVAQEAKAMDAPPAHGSLRRVVEHVAGTATQTRSQRSEGNRVDHEAALHAGQNPAPATSLGLASSDQGTIVKITRQ